jgi:hypothetical protein
MALEPARGDPMWTRVMPEVTCGSVLIARDYRMNRKFLFVSGTLQKTYGNSTVPPYTQVCACVEAWECLARGVAAELECIVRR